MKVTKNIARFQYITNQWAYVGIEEQVQQVCSAGSRWIQLRLKNMEEEACKNIALRVQSICKKYNATFILNDNVQLAKEINADGVHLGQNDLSPATARNILGNNAIIGGTANSFEQIQKLNNQKIDYIGLGPFRFTKTKKNLAPILGLAGYKHIIENCTKAEIELPLIGIGGITPDDIPEILKTGIYGIAASSIISNADVKKTTTDILNRIITDRSIY